MTPIKTVRKTDHQKNSDTTAAETQMMGWLFQEPKVKFNRAMLMNIGFNEARRLYDYDCYVFHDVDLLPEDDRNVYSCPDQPRHMSVAIDSKNYQQVAHPFESSFPRTSPKSLFHLSVPHPSPTSPHTLIPQVRPHPLPAALHRSPSSRKNVTVLSYPIPFCHSQHSFLQYNYLIPSAAISDLNLITTLYVCLIINYIIYKIIVKYSWLQQWEIPCDALLLRLTCCCIIRTVCAVVGCRTYKSSVV